MSFYDRFPPGGRDFFNELGDKEFKSLFKVSKVAAKKIVLELGSEMEKISDLLK